MTERSRLRAACYNRCRTSDTVRLVLPVVLVTGVVAGSLITLNRGRTSRIRGLGLSEFSVPVNRIWCTCSGNRYFRIAVRHPRRIDHRPTIETACGLHRSHFLRRSAVVDHRARDGGRNGKRQHAQLNTFVSQLLDDRALPIVGGDPGGRGSRQVDAGVEVPRALTVDVRTAQGIFASAMAQGCRECSLVGCCGKSPNAAGWSTPCCTADSWRSGPVGGRRLSP